MTIYNWSTTAGSNASSDATADLAANQPGIDTRNSVRAIMARIAAWLDQIGGACTYGGSGNAYTVTSPSGHALTSYATGQMLALVPNATNTGAATVNVDGLGAKTIKRPTGADVASGDLANGGRYLLVYDGTNFQAFNDLPSAAAGVYQPLDATLTAWGGLSFSGSNAFAYATGTDAFAVTDAAGFRTQLGLTSAATTALASLVQTTGTQTVAGAKTFTSDLTFTTDVTGIVLSGGGRLRDQASPSRTLLQVNGDNLTVLDEAGTTTLMTLTGSGLSIGATFDTVYHAGNLPSTSITWTGAANFTAGLQASGVAVVSLSATQTLTNKTLTSPTINGGTSSTRAQASSETSGTLTSASANKTIQATGDITIDNSVFSAGDIVVIYAGAASRALTQGAGVTMRFAGTATTGSRTLAARGIATLFFVSASEVAVGGSGVT